MSNVAIDKKARELLAAAYRQSEYPPMGHESHNLIHGRPERRERAALAAIVAALTPQWQPIKTAPKDGSLILLGRPGDEADDRLPISTPGRWFHGYDDGVDYMGHDDGFMDVDLDVFDCPHSFGAESYPSAGYQPTQWMPLPAAPEAA